MTDLKPWRGAWIYRNQDFILIETTSGYPSPTVDPDGAQHYLNTDADDETLGRYLINALSKSRFITPDKASQYPYFFGFNWMLAWNLKVTTTRGLSNAINNGLISAPK